MIITIKILSLIYVTFTFEAFKGIIIRMSSRLNKKYFISLVLLFGLKLLLNKRYWWEYSHSCNIIKIEYYAFSFVCHNWHFFFIWTSFLKFIESLLLHRKFTFKLLEWEFFKDYCFWWYKSSIKDRVA